TRMATFRARLCCSPDDAAHLTYQQTSDRKNQCQLSRADAADEQDPVPAVPGIALIRFEPVRRILEHESSDSNRNAQRKKQIEQRTPPFALSCPIQKCPQEEQEQRHINRSDQARARPENATPGQWEKTARADKFREKNRQDWRRLGDTAGIRQPGALRCRAAGSG